MEARQTHDESPAHALSHPTHAPTCTHPRTLLHSPIPTLNTTTAAAASQPTMPPSPPRLRRSQSQPAQHQRCYTQSAPLQGPAAHMLGARGPCRSLVMLPLNSSRLGSALASLAKASKTSDGHVRARTTPTRSVPNRRTKMATCACCPWLADKIARRCGVRAGPMSNGRPRPPEPALRGLRPLTRPRCLCQHNHRACSTAREACAAFHMSFHVALLTFRHQSPPAVSMSRSTTTGLCCPWALPARRPPR